MFQGDGTAGALLATANFTLSDGFSGFYLVDFSSVALTAGSQYTLAASIVGDSPHWGIATSSMPHPGGGPTIQIVLSEEFALRVNPLSVPEPVSSALVSLGAFAVLARCRRRRARLVALGCTTDSPR